MTQITLREKERILSALEASLDPKVFETWCRALEIETHHGRLPCAF